MQAQRVLSTPACWKPAQDWHRLLKPLTPISKLRANLHLTASCLRLQDKQGNLMTQDTLRIMRTHVRRALLARIPEEWMHYGKICTSANLGAKSGDPVQLKFADGSTEECDLLVVADGASSKLRAALLPGEVNRYAGLSMMFVSFFPAVAPFHLLL